MTATATSPDITTAWPWSTAPEDLTLEQAQWLSALTPQGLMQGIARGDLPATRINGAVRIRKDDLIAFHRADRASQAQLLQQFHAEHAARIDELGYRQPPSGYREAPGDAERRNGQLRLLQERGFQHLESHVTDCGLELTGTLPDGRYFWMIGEAPMGEMHAIDDHPALSHPPRTEVERVIATQLGRASALVPCDPIALCAGREIVDTVTRLMDALVPLARD